MFNDIFCDRYDNKDECLRNANIVKTFAGEQKAGIGQWSFIGPGSEKKWYPSENSPQGAWDHIAEDMLLQFAESRIPSGSPCRSYSIRTETAQLKSQANVREESVLRPLYPRLPSVIVDTEKVLREADVYTLHRRSRYTLIQFIALFFLSISSVSTEQWQLYARNLKTTKIERGNL